MNKTTAALSPLAAPALFTLLRPSAFFIPLAFLIPLVFLIPSGPLASSAFLAPSAFSVAFNFLFFGRLPLGLAFFGFSASLSSPFSDFCSSFSFCFCFFSSCRRALARSLEAAMLFLQ
ncbi:hypothetical protein BCR43DRAFT_219678 [Syncephalastrum racemosum]|uniref:Transmembrane protein n=1 Tax=Syncephalastrum racemosum TaxID=13706 RepID=A0A1X2HJ55_SYNRA|nr:hypothetical protein BCR43DRAFT_219678 [Syncephalastrum racemosum]